MLYRIEMHVVHMCAVISVITDRMFPEPLLPNAIPITILQRFCEPHFDTSPSAGEIPVIFSQRPDAMHVVRQNNPCINMKRPRQANRADGGAERFDFAHQQAGTAVRRVYREEIGSSGNAVAAVFGHSKLYRNLLVDGIDFFEAASREKGGGGFAQGRGGVLRKMADYASLIRPTGSSFYLIQNTQRNPQSAKNTVAWLGAAESVPWPRM